jgi:hypothetical protein
MMKCDETVVMRAIAICFKPYLKPEEALIYCNLGRTQFSKKTEAFGIFKSASGYFKKEDLDKMLSGESLFQRASSEMTIGSKNRSSRA